MTKLRSQALSYREMKRSKLVIKTNTSFMSGYSSSE